jgi:hypothetical protein
VRFLRGAPSSHFGCSKSAYSWMAPAMCCTSQVLRATRSEQTPYGSLFRLLPLVDVGWWFSECPRKHDRGA